MKPEESEVNHLISGAVPAVAPSVVTDSSVMSTSVTSVMVGDEVEGMVTTRCLVRGHSDLKVGPTGGSGLIF